jgi:cellulose biosynthesis protein BcsQ
MFSVSIFNNKGGVGKTTLTYHLGHALASLGKRVLLVDLDPQCNLTILSLRDPQIFKIWDAEEDFIADYSSFETTSVRQQDQLLRDTRSVHFLLKPAEDGLSDPADVPPPLKLEDNIYILPGRLTLHSFEDKIGERWSNAYKGDPLSVRTITQIRTMATKYAEDNDFDFIIFDTSPSLGMLNRVVLSMTDGFIVPCLPDKFSLYGIKNIGNALNKWKKEFELIKSLQADSRKTLFPDRFVGFLGYTIYNARPYRQKQKQLNKWDLATGHYNFAKQIPDVIRESFPKEMREHLSELEIDEPIGGTSVMHTHNTLPNVSQKYHMPIWRLPSNTKLEKGDSNTIRVNRAIYETTKTQYEQFAQGVIERVERLTQ